MDRCLIDEDGDYVICHMVMEKRPYKAHNQTRLFGNVSKIETSINRKKVLALFLFPVSSIKGTCIAVPNIYAAKGTARGRQYQQDLYSISKVHYLVMKSPSRWSNTFKKLITNYPNEKYADSDLEDVNDEHDNERDDDDDSESDN